MIFQAGHVAGQFIPAPPTCPGDTFTFRCTVGGGNIGVTIWRVSRRSECILAHSTVDAPYPCGSGSAFTATSGTGFGTEVASYSSTLSGTATSDLNGTLVECFGPGLARDATNTVGKSMLQILGQYYFFLSDEFCPFITKLEFLCSSLDFFFNINCWLQLFFLFILQILQSLSSFSFFRSSLCPPLLLC